MKHKITKFKNPQVALQEIAQFVRDPRHLDVGRKVKKFDGLLPRELLGNWLLCAVANGDNKDGPMTFTTDPDGGDGILYDVESQRSWRTEHVYVPVPARDDHRLVEDRIADAVRKKQAKGGAPYASGKVLVVFWQAPLVRFGRRIKQRESYLPTTLLRFGLFPSTCT